MDVNSIEWVLTDDMSSPFPLKINITFLVSLKSQSALCYTLSIYPFSCTLYAGDLDLSILLFRAVNFT